MVYEIKKYFCDRIPQEEDVKEVFNKTVETNTVGDLCWFGPAHGYYGDDEYCVRVHPTDTFENIMNRLPKIYGV